MPSCYNSIHIAKFYKLISRSFNIIGKQGTRYNERASTTRPPTPFLLNFCSVFFRKFSKFSIVRINLIKESQLFRLSRAFGVYCFEYFFFVKKFVKFCFRKICAKILIFRFYEIYTHDLNIIVFILFVCILFQLRFPKINENFYVARTRRF